MAEPNDGDAAAAAEADRSPKPSPFRHSQSATYDAQHVVDDLFGRLQEARARIAVLEVRMP